MISSNLCFARVLIGGIEMLMAGGDRDEDGRGGRLMIVKVAYITPISA